MGLKQTYGWRFKTGKSFMTTSERQQFKELRESGTISIFQVAACEACGADVIKGKRFCSERCSEEKANGKQATGKMDR